MEQLPIPLIIIQTIFICSVRHRVGKTVFPHCRKENTILILHSFFSISDAIVNKISNGGLKTNSVDLEDDDEDGDTDTAQDLEGSADQPLDF